MYPEVNTTNTWAWIKAIPSSKPENAIIKAKGIKPRKKNIIPLVIILYVKPANMFNNMWPDKMFAAKRKPKEIFLAKYERLYSWLINIFIF